MSVIAGAHRGKKCVASQIDERARASDANTDEYAYLAAIILSV